MGPFSLSEEKEYILVAVDYVSDVGILRSKSSPNLCPK